MAKRGALNSLLSLLDQYLTPAARAAGFDKLGFHGTPTLSNNAFRKLRAPHVEEWDQYEGNILQDYVGPHVAVDPQMASYFTRRGHDNASSGSIYPMLLRGDVRDLPQFKGENDIQSFNKDIYRTIYQENPSLIYDLIDESAGHGLFDSSDPAEMLDILLNNQNLNALTAPKFGLNPDDVDTFLEMSPNRDLAGEMVDTYKNILKRQGSPLVKYKMNVEKNVPGSRESYLVVDPTAADFAMKYSNGGLV